MSSDGVENYFEESMDQFKNELRSVFKRWYEESDLDYHDMGVIGVELIEEVTETTVQFDSDIDLDEED